MDRIALGKWGEEKAVTFLKKNGYSVIERNFRCLYGEIDIIASIGDCLCFIEVKTRTSVEFGLPCEAVNRRKQRHIKSVCQYYLLLYPEFQLFSPRIDIIEILCLYEGSYVRHLPSVF